MATTTQTAPSRWAGQRASMIMMSSVILGLHLVGWGVLILLVAPNNYAVGTAQVFGIGLGVTAYTLGMRHAFDADHIAAIDNTTRKLISDGKRPVSVGFWFSLGHSTVVFVLVALLAAGIRAIAGQLEEESSVLQQVTGVVGTTVSGVFLCLIGVLNLIALVGIVRVFRRMRSDRWSEQELEHQLARRGFMNRFLSRFMKAISRPGQMYPVGVLFGLGFDTATEIGLLVLAGGAAAFDLPWYAILTLPILFAAGMSLLDTIDGWLMNSAYGWAFTKPVRKIYYNIVITSLSVAVALVIGVIELLSVLASRAGITSGPLAAIAGLDLSYVGYGIVALFVVTWLVALGIWKFGRVEERWSHSLVNRVD